MSDHHDPHSGLHSEQGALAGEHPGRAANPVVKVHDLAWLEFEKPDLRRAELFAAAFGFATSLRTADELMLRGTDPGAPCVIIRKGPRSRFRRCRPSARPTRRDVLRLADVTGRQARKLPESVGGIVVELTDPNGIPVRVVLGHARAGRAARADTADASTSGTTRCGPTAPSGPRATRPGCSGSGTWCCRPPGTGRRWTGTCSTSA